MPSSEVYEDLRKLRLNIIDGSYADIFVSASGRYSYHWERSMPGAKSVYRHDNAPMRFGNRL